MANSKETYSYIADPANGRWTYANEKGTCIIEYLRGRFHVDGNAYVLISQAIEYAFNKLGIPQLLPS